MNIVIGGIILTIIWGLVPVLQKKVLTQEISSVSLMFITGTIYYILLFVYGVYHKDTIVQDLQKINGHWDTISIIFILNFIGVVIYYALLTSHPSSSVVVITSIWPLFSLLFAYYLLNENITPELIFLLVVILGMNIYLFQHKLVN